VHDTVCYVGLVEDFAPVRHRVRPEDLVHYRRQLAHIRGQFRRIGVEPLVHPVHFFYYYY
jgi:hypothetical protein